MTTIAPRLAVAIAHAGLHPAAAGGSSPAHASSGAALLVILLAVTFVVVVVRVNAHFVSLVAQLFQLAAAVGITVIMSIVVGALFLALLLHR